MVCWESETERRFPGDEAEHDVEAVNRAPGGVGLVCESVKVFALLL